LLEEVVALSGASQEARDPLGWGRRAGRWPELDRTLRALADPGQRARLDPAVRLELAAIDDECVKLVLPRIGFPFLYETPRREPSTLWPQVELPPDLRKPRAGWFATALEHVRAFKADELEWEKRIRSSPLGPFPGGLDSASMQRIFTIGTPTLHRVVMLGASEAAVAAVLALPEELDDLRFTMYESFAWSDPELTLGARPGSPRLGYLWGELLRQRAHLFLEVLRAEATQEVDQVARALAATSLVRVALVGYGLERTRPEIERQIGLLPTFHPQAAARFLKLLAVRADQREDRSGLSRPACRALGEQVEARAEELRGLGVPDPLRLAARLRGP
jgi:hypothetical protein